MSVNLLITSPRLEPPYDYFPITSQQTFNDDWLPVAEALSLRYVAKFGYGMVRIDRTNLPVILDELVRLEEYISKQKPELVETVGRRASLLIGKLRPLGSYDVVDAEIV